MHALPKESRCCVNQIPQKSFSSNIFPETVPFLIKNGFRFPTLPTGKLTIYNYAHYEEWRKGKSGSDWFIQQVSMRALWYSPFNLYSVPVKISPLLQYSLIALLPRIEAITNALKYQGVRQKSQWNKTHLLLWHVNKPAWISSSFRLWCLKGIVHVKMSNSGHYFLSHPISNL